MIVLNYKGEVISLPASVGGCIKDATEIELKVLICLCSNADIRHSDNVFEVLSKKLGYRINLVKEAIEYWKGIGVLGIEDKEDNITDVGDWQIENSENDSTLQNEDLMPAQEKPNYSGKQLEELLNANNGKRKLLIKGCQQIIGKLFNANESAIIVELSDYLGLEDEYILLLFQHCHKMGKNSVKYVERTAYGFVESGIDNYDKLDSHLKYIESKSQREGVLKHLFGTGMREFTSKEKDSISNWYDTYCYDDEIIKHAFEVTVENTKNNVFNFKYMTSVIDNWYKNGCKKMEDIVEYESNHQKAKLLEKQKSEKKPIVKKNEGSFTTDDFVAAAKKKAKNDN